ncbi:flavodoxin family protein [Tistrella mobilis]|uniref:NADPH-dependent FMN reductase n=1 Tax=Tistrella mobilis (strain KA081020-065) TaxID=1110502 RepID=I3TSH9_TISMK|nr:NAD(P)H-dependent oxidoreductase [Tistrella mobilis]AFK55717.1 NADPH-dependent FMN reductase [Tistrella mobilis KA081020-065]
MAGPKTIRAFGINCTLKGGDAESSTDLLLSQFLARLGRDGVETASIRAVDHDIKPGITADEGPGDAWPAIRRQVLDAQILVIGTPIWLGQPSSVCKRVLERLNAFLTETDEAGRLRSYGRAVALVVVGNEDGAHHVAAEVYQGLADVGFTIPPNAVVYWVGEAMGKTDYKDLPAMPDKIGTTIDLAARNVLHLARLLAENQYPPDGQPAKFRED